MQVKEIMTAAPVCCTKQTNVVDVARMMRDQDCGALPVVENDGVNQELIGMITDRDIVVRGLADGAEPSRLTAGDCMTMVVATVNPQTRLDECAKLMEEHQVRRVPVVENGGACCGIVSQADLARNAPFNRTGEVVLKVSQPGELPPLCGPNAGEG
jgi:CBS domain-containing protein